jgi:two-component system, NarL family, response regulator DevR
VEDGQLIEGIIGACGVLVAIAARSRLHRAALEAILSRDGRFTVLAATQPEQALDVARDCRPDVTLIDVSDVGAARCVASVRHYLPELPVVAVVGPDQDEDLLLASLAAGAHAVLDDSLGPADVLVALRAAHRGDVIYTNRAAAVLREQARVIASERHARLTQRERRVHELMQEGLSNHQIADTLVVEVQTVKNYVRSVRAKLQIRGRRNGHAGDEY